MKRAALIFMTSAALLSAPSAFAQAQTGTSAKPATEKSATAGDNDTTAKGFLSKAAQDGMAEVELGKLASNKATNAEVKAFAQQMITDHTKANDEVKALAGKKNISLPMSPDAKHKAEHDKLASLSGAAFDKAYIQSMVANHEKAVGLFKQQSTANQDADVKAWAAKTLPTLEQHLTKVRSIEKMVDVSTN